MWKTVWGTDEDLAGIGVASVGRNPYEAIAGSLKAAGKQFPTGTAATNEYRVAECKKGLAQFVVGWQDRERKLFNLAGEVAAKLK